MKAKITLIATIFAIVGCASTSNVLPIGPDTYRVIASRDNFRGGAAGAQEAALQSAQQHCLSINKELVVTNTSSSITPPHHNNFTVTFRCLNKGDPDLKRPNLQKSPDVLIKDNR